jgi:hypothetical protein
MNKTKKQYKKRNNKYTISKLRKQQHQRRKNYSKGKLRKYRITRKHIYKIKGGNCGCSAPLLQAGGKGLPPLPDTHVSTPWGGNVSQWPGVGGPQAGSWLPMNPMKIDLQTGKGIVQENLIENQFTNGKANPHFVGGKRKRKSKRLIKGGGLLGNLYQNLKFGVGGAYNTLYGYEQPVNPAPYVQTKLTGSSLR